MSTFAKWICILVLSLASIPSYAQFYIWGESINYEKEVANMDYKYCYKIDGYWRQTLIHYKMVDKASFDNKIEITNTNYYNEWQMYAIKISIDGRDTLFITEGDSSRITIAVDTIPQNMSFSIYSRPNRINVPITDFEVPSLITIIWGLPNDGQGVLTIRSKIELNQEDIDDIQQSVANGNRSAPDDYYFFISDM